MSSFRLLGNVNALPLRKIGFLSRNQIVDFPVFVAFPFLYFGCPIAIFDLMDNIKHIRITPNSTLILKFTNYLHVSKGNLRQPPFGTRSNVKQCGTRAYRQVGIHPDLKAIL